MKIVIGVAHHAYSFIIQAKALHRGFVENGIDCRLVYLEDGLLAKICSLYSPKYVITVGNWIDAPILLPKDVTSKFKVCPWIVSDDYLIYKYVDLYNTHGLVFTTSQHCKNNLVRSGINEKYVSIVSEAVDSSFWHPISKKEIRMILKNLTIIDSGPNRQLAYNLVRAYDEKVPILYTIGGDATKKGAQEVIKALSLLDKKIKWVYLIKTWPSPGIFERSIEELKLAKELGVDNRIRYLSGEFSEVFMRGLLNACSIYTAPSRSEGFGLPLVEAQMCGKPVITTTGTAAGETIIPGKTGLLAELTYVEGKPRADVIDLSMKLQKLIRSRSLRIRMGKHAGRYAAERFSPHVVAKEFLRSIESRFNT